ncbi:NAD(P)H-dependent flavin oxidoreductase [Phosphitispora fastidiosa]|uniref:NAD(P)H-dependent flavin oxidoreductase n=1 Tax=Phosphitispora fastidiosa TaxID=2837202 RepID=UPI001E2BDF30|nr:nitronate monooxygenase [Phosphitispora fastidiosa]MBU7005480.1 NAD(P)H-dependent flavin oxidoreductase YrpB (nitropropane dioxygenase family) [Phosphitispora fastidiosa]
MKFPDFKIGDLIPDMPIIQGGMAVRISTADLAAAVAEEGGVGLIAATGMSVDELRKEIAKARDLTKGIVGINIMFAAREFANLVKTAIDEGIDLIVSGAGFSRDMFTWGKASGVPVVPIVSTPKLAQLSERLGAAAVVVEGKEAGGHLGTLESMKDLIPKVRAAVKIPVIAAGGIIDGSAIKEAFGMGANAVQMGTRFVASEECNASEEFKRLYLKAEPEDVVLIQSPVGLPGRSIMNSFIRRLFDGDDLKPDTCDNCLKKCSRSFCILKALIRSQQGDTENGLVFSGERVGEIKDILPVKEIFKRLLLEMDKAESGV